MKRRPLGGTGLQCSEIGLGTWALGSRAYGEMDPDAAAEAIRAALDAGINFFDTAPLYGTPSEDGIAERVLGAGLGARRQQVVIATKFGRTATKVSPPRFTAAEARASCEASLRRLKREWVDVLFFHSPFEPAEIDDGVWEELQGLRDEGKVRHLGHSVSMYARTSAMSAEWIRERRIEVIQVVLSPFNRETRPLIAPAAEANCGVVARECLANGFLSGTIHRDTVFPEGSLNARYSRHEIAERAGCAERLWEALRQPGIETLPRGVYRWVLDQPGVSLALSGARNRDELMDAVRASGAASYDPGVLSRIEAMHDRDFPPA